MHIPAKTQVLVQQMLRTAATQPDPVQCLPQLFQTAGAMIEASGACLQLFAAPNTIIMTGDITLSEQQKHEFEVLVRSLPGGWHLNPRHNNGRLLFENQYLVSPVVSEMESRVIGGICFFSAGLLNPLTDDERIVFESLADLVTVIAMNIHMREQQIQSENLTMSILNSITDPLFVVDREMRVVLLNPSAARLFNTQSEEAQGRFLRDVVGSDELMQLVEDNNRSMTEWVSPENKTFVPRIEPIRSQDDSVEGCVLTLRDITRFKKLNRNQNEFTRIVSHDLRSPLTSMQGFANMLELGLVGELNEKQAHFVEKILSGISQMTALVENIQDAGRYDPETGFYELSRSQCDLKEIVNRIVENHLVPAEKQDLRLSWHVDDNVPIINADMHMLERAVTNLIDNAIKYTPNGGSVDVKVAEQDDQVIISVSDSGFGISPENQKHLFERHVRIPRQEHKKVKGSGLGLFIVRSVAQRHGGDAWVRSVEGEGSTFYMSIPLQGVNLVGAESQK